MICRIRRGGVTGIELRLPSGVKGVRRKHNGGNPLKLLLITSLVLAATASVTFAQQTPPPTTMPSTPPVAQSQPVLPLTPVPEVMMPPGNEPSAPGHDALPPRPPGPIDAGWKGHGEHRPPPPPSKAAHFRIEDGETKIDVKCADDEPTKVCSDVLMQIIDKLSPSSDGQDDERE